MCNELPLLTTRTRICLVMHRDEARKPTNTGRLVARCVEHSQILIHGEQGTIAAEPDFSGRVPLVLYPSEDAQP